MTAPVILPRLSVDAPAAPVPHKFGLFSVATVLENVDPHALTGIEYEAVCSTKVDPYPAACRPGDTADRRKYPAPTTDVVNATPFAVYAADECVLGRDQATARRQLRERYYAGEETAVEHIVFTGVLGNIPNLQQEATIIPADTAPDLVDAIGLLEQWLATAYGGVGVIHAPMTIANRAQDKYQIGVNGPRAGTILGSAWAFGAGYPGTPPTNGGADDGSLWLYATPPVTVRRSALIEPADWDSGAFSIAENVGLLIEERLYVVDWPCGAAAVKTNITRPGYITPPTPAAPVPPAPAGAAGVPQQRGGDEADSEITTQFDAIGGDDS